MRTWILSICVFSLNACAPDIEQHQGDPLAVLTVGTWDWAGAENSCETNPHSIGFADDKKHFWVHFHEGKTEAISGVANYTVSAISGAVISSDMEGENRTDDEGNLVSWDLIVNSPTEYCWRRSDWPCRSGVLPFRRCCWPRWSPPSVAEADRRWY